MPTTIITTDDLMDFKMELLDEIKDLMAKGGYYQGKRYLKSSEAMKLLRISPSTLQNLRLNGTLPYSKIGGVILYDSVEIHRVMAESRTDNGTLQ